MTTRRDLLIAGAALPFAARAQQGYPNKPIRLVVPYGPGGGADNFARPLAQKMSEQMGQQVLIENRAGASGLVGGVTVAKAPADGYTLLCNFASLYLAPVVTKNPPYDPVKDFTPIVLAATTPMVVVVHPSLPATNMKEIIEAARTTAGGLHYVTAGAGTQQHLTGETLALRTKSNFTHVAYKGGSQAMADLVGGQVKMGILVLSTVLPLIQSGKLRVIGVIESKRSSNYPDIPTLAEVGLPGFAMPDTFIGLYGPAGLPQPIVRRVNAEVRKALDAADVRTALKSAGYEPSPNSPEEFTAIAAKTYAMYQRMVDDTKLKFE